MQPGLAGAERVFEFLETPDRDQGSARGESLERLRRVPSHSRMPPSNTDPASPYSVTSLMEIPPGSVVALVGPSGAGKSTLADLVGRFFDVTSGRVTVDGVDVRDWTVSSLRASMGIVPQETVLFHDTIAANIAYGSQGHDRPGNPPCGAGSQCARRSSLPCRGGTICVVGERGTRLSGGERQCIALARAILSDRPILIFDEATSALDTESERLVQEAVGRLMGGRTVLVIGHRLSTVRRADLILVLQGGTNRRAGRPCLPVRGGRALSTPLRASAPEGYR